MKDGIKRTSSNHRRKAAALIGRERRTQRERKKEIILVQGAVQLACSGAVAGRQSRVISTHGCEQEPQKQGALRCSPLYSLVPSHAQVHAFHEPPKWIRR